MKITVVTTGDATFNLDVHEDLELENFKAFCEVESGVASSEIVLMHNGHPLAGEQKTLKEHGLSDGDLVMLQNKRPGGAAGGAQLRGGAQLPGMPQFDFSSIQIPGRPTTSPGQTPRPAQRQDEDDPAFIRDQLLKDPQQLALLKQNNPPLSDALLSGDFERFSKMIREMQQQHRDRELQRLRLLTADSMDVEAQRLIEAEIRQKQVDANMEAAMEFSPESFGTVCMLYINLKVNGVPVKAFIDSGAQTTIMSTECAERCRIMRLVDTRFSGIAKGVGTQKILGRIHMVQVQIGNDFFVSSFSILEDQKMDMLLGLDMLKRHLCVIDLQKNVLRIGTTGTETTFLPESELPESARLTQTKSESLMENEEAVQMAGGEHEILSRAIEESMMEQRQKRGAEATGSSGSAGASAGPSQRSTRLVTAIDQPVSGPEDLERTIQEISRLGFRRDQVEFELQRNNGDKTKAIAALIAKSLKSRDS